MAMNTTTFLKLIVVAQGAWITSTGMSVVQDPWITVQAEIERNSWKAQLPGAQDQVPYQGLLYLDLVLWHTSREDEENAQQRKGLVNY